MYIYNQEEEKKQQQFSFEEIIFLTKIHEKQTLIDEIDKIQNFGYFLIKYQHG